MLLRYRPTVMSACYIAMNLLSMIERYVPDWLARVLCTKLRIDSGFWKDLGFEVTVVTGLLKFGVVMTGVGDTC